MNRLSTCINPSLYIASMLLLCLSAFFTAGCSTTYYATMETLGKHKRDLLRDNVASAQEEQQEAQEQFKDALTRLKELTQFDGGKLEETYNALKEDYDACVERTNDVSSRIEKIDTIANDLFAEWEKEIQLITNATYKADSKKKLKVTQTNYAKLNKSLTQSESRMQAVLVRFRDHVLYLKHNLNAQTIGGLKSEAASIEKDIQKLITDMQGSIKEADGFIKTL